MASRIRHTEKICTVKNQENTPVELQVRVTVCVLELITEPSTYCLAVAVALALLPDFLSEELTIFQVLA